MSETPRFNQVNIIAWCLHIVVTLRIAEHIDRGITDIAGLTNASGSDRDALHAVLGYLVQKGVFEQPELGRFALNEPARQLLDPSRRIGLDLEGIGGRMALTWMAPDGPVVETMPRRTSTRPAICGDHASGREGSGSTYEQR